MRLTPQTGRRIRKRLEELAALERAVIDAAVSEYEIHLAAAREHITKGRQYCKCRICVTVKALLAERGKP